MYRVKVVHLHVPPLRAHLEDLPALIEHMVKRVGRPIVFTDQAIKYLQTYYWPGNVRELHNIIEQISWIAETDVIDVEELRQTVPLDTSQPLDRDRAHQMANELFDALKSGQLTFWGDVYPRFLQRDLTRDDLRALVRRGLEQADGNYRAMLPLLGIGTHDYKKFLNCLAAHECAPDFRTFRPSRRVSAANA